MGSDDLVLNTSPCAENTSSQSFIGAGVPAFSDAIALQQYQFEKLLADQQLWSSQLVSEHEAKIKETAEQIKENASELQKLLKGGDDISPKLKAEESFHERYMQDLQVHSKSPPHLSKSVSRLASPNKYKEERRGSEDHSPRGHITNHRATNYHTRDELKGNDSSSYRSGETRIRSRHRDRDRDRDRGRRRSRSRSRGRGRSKGRGWGSRRSRSRSKDRHRGRDRGRSRSRSRSKDRHRKEDGRRGRSRSKDRHRKEDGHRGRSRSKDRHRKEDGQRGRSRSKDRHRGRDRRRSRSRSRKGRRYCNKDACHGWPGHLISQSCDSRCRIPSKSSNADDKCLLPSNDVLGHSSTDLWTKENSVARTVGAGEKNAKEKEKEWIGTGVKHSSTQRCPSNELPGERITGEHNSKKSVAGKSTPVCRNYQTRDGRSFMNASRGSEMSGDSPNSIDNQQTREEGEIVG